MKKVLAWLLLISVCVTWSSAAENTGGLPGYFLNLGIGTRVLGMGRAGTAVADDISALYWNPAGLRQMRNLELMFNHNELFELTKYECIGVAVPTKYNWSFGLGLVQMFSPGTVKRDYFNTVTGEVSDVNSALLFSNAFSVTDKLQLGIGTKVVNKKFDDIDSTWLGFDFGALYTLTEIVRVGLDIQNIFVSSFRRYDTDYKAPMMTRVGVSSSLLDNALILTADLELTSSQYLKIYCGAEYRVWNIMMLRLGYDSNNLTAGFGVVVNNFLFDYAMLSHTLGLSHRAAVTYRFGKYKNITLPAKVDIIVPKKKIDYAVTVNTMKEIPVAVYHLFDAKNVAVTSINITNSTKKEVKFSVSARIDIKKSDEFWEVVVPPGETKELNIVPSLTREEVRAVEVVPTLSKISVEVYKLNAKGKPALLLHNMLPVTLLPYDQFVQEIVDAKNVKYDMIDTLATWVTYNDRSLTDVISKASEKGAASVPPIKIVGVQSPHLFTRPTPDSRSVEEKDQDYLTQVKLIYDTLKDNYGMTYINQPIAYGFSQRIKLPSEVLKNKGNCVELAVLFSSLLESIELDPIILLSIEDGHAVVGWRVAGEEKDVYHLMETSLFGEDFDKVLNQGNALIEQYGLQPEFAGKISFNANGVYKKDGDVLVLDIKKIHSFIPPSPNILR
ncbi:MAG: PorV/PorQ family protein [Elusimicrobiota bacterium]